MKSITFLFVVLWGLSGFAGELMSHKLKTIDGEDLPLQSFKGKTLLVVNIATKCGFTDQLEGLEALYQKYRSKGFVVLGVPSNDFGGQTPESNKGVRKFCKLNYGVKFPLTAKTKVRGPEKHPFIRDLLQSGKNKDEIGWNFEKFLINKKGELVARYKSRVSPSSEKLVRDVESTL